MPLRNEEVQMKKAEYVESFLYSSFFNLPSSFIYGDWAIGYVWVNLQDQRAVGKNADIAIG